MKQVLNRTATLATLGLVSLMAFVPARAHADKVTDLYFQEVIQRYFEYPQNARTFGMAGSSVQTSTDSSSVMGNPAGIGMMQGGELSATYDYNMISGHEFPTDQPVTQRSSTGSGMLALPIGPTLDGLPEYGNFGIAWDKTNGHWDNDSYDTTVERSQVTAAYSYAIDDDVSLGYSLGWTKDAFQSAAIFDYPMSKGYRHTIGATWNVDKDLTLGSSGFVGYGDHKVLYGPGNTSFSNMLEEGIDVGAGYKVEDTLWTAGVDYRHLSVDGGLSSSIPQNIVGGDENGNIFDLRLGVEQTIDDNFKLRAGYRYAGLASYNYNRAELNPLNGSAYYNAVSLGAGYVFPMDSDYIRSLKLDYGVEWRGIGHGDWEHVVTLSVPFDLCEKS